MKLDRENWYCVFIKKLFILPGLNENHMCDSGPVPEHVVLVVGQITFNPRVLACL